MPYCTITSISESPLHAGVIWVGTDDGKVQLTRDHGATWTDLTGAVAAAGGPADRYVSRVVASPHDARTAFVAKNGFRNDDFRAFLYRTTDFGKTWTAIASNLVASPINVVLQDRRSANLLIVGNDLGVWVSIDGGGAWTRLRANLPTVPVHDLTVHPRGNDLVLGTYGRGIFIGDITHLQELSAEVLAKPFHLFAVEPRTPYNFRAQGNFHLFGNAYIAVPNEPDALVINYTQMTSGKQRAEEIKARRAGRTARRNKREEAARWKQLEARGVLVNAAALAPNNSYGAPEFVRRGYYADLRFRCQDCGKDEIWTAAQQKWWYEVAKGFAYSTATRCRPCRRREQARRTESRRTHLEGVARRPRKGA